MAGKNKTTPKASLDLGVDMNEIIRESVSRYVQENKELITENIQDEVKKQVNQLKPVKVKIPERKEVEFTGRTHKKFNEALFLAQSESQLFLAGEAGTGKTTLGRQVAEAMSLEFSHISCSEGMSEAHLLGRMLFDGTYVPSDFVRAYEEGGVFLFDEIDAADANTLLVINSALANGRMSVPNRKEKPYAERHPDFICIVAGNTFGGGSINYTGRNMMDGAFTDRFALSKIELEYDEELEKELCPDEKLYNDLKHIRDKVRENRLNHVISTRAFVSAYRQKKMGKKHKDILSTLMTDWSPEEVMKCKPKE